MKTKGILLAVCLTLSSCSQPINKTSKGAVIGGAIGAGTGAIVGAQTGAAGAGTAIGAGIGAVTGGIIGNEFDFQDTKRHQLETRQAITEKKLRRQRADIARLKAQRAEE